MSVFAITESLVRFSTERASLPQQAPSQPLLTSG
jgi:hypothetical protein